MTSDMLLKDLNDAQQQAVAAPETHCLVLAGAGSGKTRVLVHRIAWLMQNHDVSPLGVLAVTFTNKAANEMRQRIEDLVGVSTRGMWVGTFHGLSHRLLRRHFEAAGLPENFQILDSDDQLRILKRIHKNLNLDEAKWPPKQSQWYINKQKENGKRPKNLGMPEDFHQEMLLRIYVAYEDVCERGGLVDFSELLLRSFELLSNNEDIRTHYQQRFRHMLVDEFQDTNQIQYRWLKALKGNNTYIMAVGDDDQSIYSWRGARVENMAIFQKEMAPVTLIRLEQNYRSTNTILSAANAVIDNNPNRMGKDLWTDGSEGEPITLYTAFDERDEAYYVAGQIKTWHNQGGALQDIAILYRSNAQSRVLEERLVDAQIPYKIYGGLRFFDRQEIKDALGYMRLVAHRNDDAAFERIVNTPTRGIGQTTLAAVREMARSEALPLWQAAKTCIENGTLSGRAKTAMEAFTTLIDTLEFDTQNLTLGEQTEEVLYRSGLVDHYKKDKSEKGESRVENLAELISATKQFVPADDPELENLPPLSAFLAHVSLETSDDKSESHQDCVHLMTLHAAKGLEFPLVIIVGLEEQLFPHKMSSEEPKGLEEERRLCYVGMTRAKQKLVLTHAEVRRLYGMERYHPVSRFIQEIPEDLIDPVRPSMGTSKRTKTFVPYAQRPVSQPGVDVGDNQKLKVGQRVTHPKFGEGVIIDFEGNGEHARLQIRFDNAGTKWLVASFAKLAIA